MIKNQLNSEDLVNDLYIAIVLILSVTGWIAGDDEDIGGDEPMGGEPPELDIDKEPKKQTRKQGG